MHGWPLPPPQWRQCTATHQSFEASRSASDFTLRSALSHHNRLCVCPSEPVTSCTTLAETISTGYKPAWLRVNCA
ncbi:hypothetical protein LSM04_007431 [Trypanosoma melophagium]|uniref:uncharacterized protein n=1 Tax=Trypanosoma melophagium TaxID=715481 RepID=UPI00351A3C42|nr:hypothetical protein LSM04_005860 [Trypanosoma melophagium]KAH9601772.1 hypothetical protein LSM04_007431 [Trypanosoma melophagium]